MGEDLHHLGAELISAAGRIVRWAPKDGVELSLASARILARLIDSGPVSISHLAAQERSSQPTISNHIQRLEQLGLVDRRRHPADARVSLVAITDKGRTELSSIRNLIGTNLRPYLERLTAKERKALRDGISIMHRLLADD